MKQYDLEYIDKLRIHELRDLARSLRISSPTTLKKEELIDKILQVVGNEETNKTSLVKCGGELDFFQLLKEENAKLLENLLNREPVNKDGEKIEKPSTIVLKSSNTLDEPITDDTPYSHISRVYSFGVGQNNSVYGEEYLEDVKGYLELDPSGYGIVRYNGYLPSDKDCYISAFTVRKLNLKRGSLIEGKAKFIIKNSPRVLCDPITVEGCAKGKNVKPFESYEYNGLGDSFKINKFDLKMKRGERQYIESMPLDEALILAKELTTLNGVNVKVINVKSRPEENFSTIDGVEIVSIPFSIAPTDVVKTISLVLERTKREIEMGKPVVLMLYNFSEIVRTFNTACTGFIDYTKFNIEAVNKISTLLYNAKNIDKKLSFSILCVDRAGMPSDLKHVLSSEILPLFNNIYSTLELHYN